MLKYKIETINEDHIVDYIIPSVMVIILFLLYILN